jgi:cytochrome c-type biogenesis protein CcmE
VPDTYKNDSEVVLEGTLGPEGFHATAMTAKCPSKYEAKTVGTPTGASN